MTEPKYIRFLDRGLTPSGKTRVWHVATRSQDKPDTQIEDYLGEIRWFGRWRCYTFYPYDQTVYEKQCLRDIANFCEEQTNLHKTQMVKNADV